MKLCVEHESLNFGVTYYGHGWYFAVTHMESLDHTKPSMQESKTHYGGPTKRGCSLCSSRFIHKDSSNIQYVSRKKSIIYRYALGQSVSEDKVEQRYLIL